MVNQVSALTLASTAGIGLLGPVLTVLFGLWWGTANLRAVVASLWFTLAGWAAWFGVVAIWRPGLDGGLVLPVAALAGLAAVIHGSVIRSLGYAAIAAITFAFVWTALVFTPIAVSLFSVSDGMLAAGLRTLDLAGGLPVLVASGAAGMAVLMAPGRPAPAEQGPTASPWPLVATMLVVWLLWILWLVGLELAIDEATPRIIANALIAPVASTVAWLVVQRIRHAATTSTAATAGLFCGLVAVTPGCGYLDVVGAIATGAIAGTVCALVGYSLARRTGHPAWLLVTSLVIAAGIGVILLGIFATRSGLAFTGQPEVLFAQSASVAVVVLYAAAGSLLLWLPIRQLDRRVRR